MRTGQDVCAATYDDATATWRVETTEGTRYDADVVVSAVGQLSDPVVPDPSLRHGEEALALVLAEQAGRRERLRAAGVPVLRWEPAAVSAFLARWSRSHGAAVRR